MEVVGAHVCERVAPLVLELDPSEAPRPRSEAGVEAPERLELGLLFGRNDVVAYAERLPVEDPLVEVEGRAPP
jgi:hypothetical protein